MKYIIGLYEKYERKQSLALKAVFRINKFLKTKGKKEKKKKLLKEKSTFGFVTCWNFILSSYNLKSLFLSCFKLSIAAYCLSNDDVK